MDVDSAESQTAKMSRMLLTHSLRLKECIRESDCYGTYPFELIDKVRVILSRISTKAQKLGVKMLTQSVPLEHLHFFFTVLHMNLHNIELAFVPGLYNVFTLKLWPRSTVDSSLDNMTLMDETLSCLFPSGFADPKVGEENVKSQIRILMKKIQRQIPFLQEVLNVTRIHDKFTLAFVKELQEDSNPVASCLVGSPLKVCVICRHQQMTEDAGFAAVDCCRYLFCMKCLKKHLKTRGNCPGCRDEIAVTVSSSYMKMPAFQIGPPKKYELILHSRGYISRLW